MLNRTLEFAGLSTRDGDDGTLTLEGLAVPWNDSISYGGIREQFAPGSIDPGTAVGRPLLWSHDRSEPIGHVTAATDTPDGLQVEAVVQPTARGRDAITLLRAGSLKGLSIGFQPKRMKNTPHGVTYTRATLYELSITPMPAYETATVTATRDQEDPVAQENTTETREVDLAPITERLDQLEARMVDTRTQAPAPQPLQVREAFARMVIDYADDRSKISQRADMVQSGNVGLTDKGRTSKEIVDYFDSQRYFVSQVASIPFPESGIVHRLPVKVEHSQVGQAPEKTAPPSRAVATGYDDFTGEWYKGYLDISYELIRTSTPGAVQIAVDDMLDQAAYQSELLFVTAVETASTLSAGGALDFTSAGTLGTDVRAVVRELRAAAGRGLPKFALTSDSYDKLVTMTDADGRRLWSTVGPTNADGSSDLVQDAVTAFGVLFFDSPHSSADIAFNDNSLKRSELPPLTLSADNVPLIGRDVAVLGNIMTVPRIADGVLRLAAS
jgi:HK97 family phage prohead protease